MYEITAFENGSVRQSDFSVVCTDGEIYLASLDLFLKYDTYRKALSTDINIHAKRE